MMHMHVLGKPFNIGSHSKCRCNVDALNVHATEAWMQVQRAKCGNRKESLTETEGGRNGKTLSRFGRAATSDPSDLQLLVSNQPEATIALQVLSIGVQIVTRRMLHEDPLPARY